MIYPFKMARLNVEVLSVLIIFSDGDCHISSATNFLFRQGAQHPCVECDSLSKHRLGTYWMMGGYINKSYTYLRMYVLATSPNFETSQLFLLNAQITRQYSKNNLKTTLKENTKFSSQQKQN